MTITGRTIGDHHITGKLYIGDVITNQKGGPILEATDADHQQVATFSQDGTAAAVTKNLTVIRGASATTLEVGALLTTPCQSGATVTVDVKKNGTTVLSSTITLNDTHTARQVVKGTVSVTTAVQDDVFEVVVTVAAGGGTLGADLLVFMKYNEDYSAT